MKWKNLTTWTYEKKIRENTRNNEATYVIEMVRWTEHGWGSTWFTNDGFVSPELSVGLFSSTQLNPTHQITDPTQPTARWTYRPMTQPNPYPTEPPYIEQQLACRKKISLWTSCHHYHPNAHRNNANTQSITSITVILGLFQTDEAVMRQLQVFTKRISQSILDTQSYIPVYTWHVFFAHLPFQTHDPTQPTKNKFSTHSRPNPIQPNPRVNPTHGQHCVSRLTLTCHTVPQVRSIPLHTTWPVSTNHKARFSNGHTTLFASL